LYTKFIEPFLEDYKLFTNVSSPSDQSGSYWPIYYKYNSDTSMGSCFNTYIKSSLGEKFWSKDLNTNAKNFYYDFLFFEYVLDAKNFYEFCGQNKLADIKDKYETHIGVERFFAKFFMYKEKLNTYLSNVFSFSDYILSPG
jgi:hypothetical protein